MRFLKGKPVPSIQEKKLSIGETKFSLPFAEFVVPDKPRILITAGLDGDEYTGIEAAYTLIDRYTKAAPSLSVTILPLVNIPGFEAGASYNPMDHLYPKHIFPGKENGRPTEQLMFALTHQYFNNVSLWIDLHSGSLHENLTPFVWSYKTKTEEVDQLTEMILSELPAGKKIYHTSPFQKITNLARKNISYLLLEAGERGRRDTNDIEMLLQWTDVIIDIIAKITRANQSFSAYTFVDEYVSPKQGMWYPQSNVGNEVKKGELLGQIYSPTHNEIATIKAKADGQILWLKATPPVQEGDILIGIGTNEKVIRA